jgi:transcription termination factor NusB
MDTAPRHQARERALSLLYEADLKSLPLADVLEALPVVPDPYTVRLVETIGSRHGEIDSLVDAAAIGCPASGRGRAPGLS